MVAVLQILTPTVTALLIAMMVAQQIQRRLHRVFVVAVLQILTPTATVLRTVRITATTFQIPRKLTAILIQSGMSARSHLVLIATVIAMGFQTPATSTVVSLKIATKIKSQTLVI